MKLRIVYTSAFVGLMGIAILPNVVEAGNTQSSRTGKTCKELKDTYVEKVARVNAWKKENPGEEAGPTALANIAAASAAARQYHAKGCKPALVGPYTTPFKGQMSRK